MSAGSSALPREAVDDFLPFGIRAFTTTREAGSFNTATAEPVGAVMGRWYALRDELLAHAPRFATARQVHGSVVAVHEPGWEGWLRVGAADGHLSVRPGTAMAVTVADCVPVFLAHPSGACALLHAGWRGIAAGILERGVGALHQRGIPPSELRVHLGPAICGACYEVSPDVHRQLTGQPVSGPATVDLRGLLAGRAARSGVTHLSVSPWCTRCHNERFFSHRAGDEGRQLGVMVAEA